MGLEQNVAAVLVREHAHRPITGDVVLLRHQDLYFTPEAAKALIQAEGLPIPPGIAPDASENGNFIGIEAFLRLLGVSKFQTLDAPGTPGAAYQHDLNQPLPDTLCNVADFILDANTFDNAWDAATAIRNVGRLLKPHGRLISVCMGSNHFNPYTVLTPQWLLDYFVANQFSDCQVFMFVYDTSSTLCIFTPDPEWLLAEDGRFLGNFASDQTMAVVVFAEKGPHSTWDRLPGPRQGSVEARAAFRKSIRSMLATRRPFLARSSNAAMPHSNLSPPPGWMYVNNQGLRDAALPPEVKRAVESVGGAPLLALHVPLRTGPTKVLLCPTENERLIFASALAELSKELGGCRFVDGLEQALRHEVYAAAFAFFDSVHVKGSSGAHTIALEAGRDPRLTPVLTFTAGSLKDDISPPVERVALLSTLFDHYLDRAEKSVTRDALVASLAFALCRLYGLAGAYDSGLTVLQRVDAAGLYYVHFEACKYALECLKRGVPLAPRLEKFAGHDSGCLEEFYCWAPYKIFHVTPRGEINLGCGVVLPEVIGNISHERVDDIWNSDKVLRIRDSVVDGTFRYCNHVKCQRLINYETVLSRKSAPDADMAAVVHGGKRKVDTIDHLWLGYDTSCNLSCPSCRTEIFAAQASEEAEKTRVIEEKLVPVLPKVRYLVLDTTGEFLVSRPARKLLQSIDPALCPDLGIELMSNGTLLSESEWAKFSNIHGLVKTIRISIDAATPATFELLRRGGKWDSFRRNLEFISRLRRDGQISDFRLAFAYQLANFREMSDCVLLAESLGVDQLCVNRLVQMPAMTSMEFQERAVHLPEHPLHGEFLKEAAAPAMARRVVAADFEADWMRPSAVA